LLPNSLSPVSCLTNSGLYISLSLRGRSLVLIPKSLKWLLTSSAVFASFIAFALSPETTKVSFFPSFSPFTLTCVSGSNLAYSLASRYVLASLTPFIICTVLNNSLETLTIS
jgi:hypothetical protein